MKGFLSITVVLLIAVGLNQKGYAQDEVPSAEKQIKAAVSPAPEEEREGATVMGYNKDGELTTLQDGTNDLICLADDPSRTDFHVACYHKDLEPFMKRGRELRAEGKSRGEIQEIRNKEIESGEISLPDKPMALYSLTGPDDGFDYSKEQLREASPLYVVYIPYATVEETGIPPSPISDGAPWLMDPGKPWAHIMVSTGQTLGKDEK